MVSDKRRERDVFSPDVRAFRATASAVHARVAQIARLIMAIIDSADLHRSLARSFRAGDFSQVHDTADSWKQQRGPLAARKARSPWARLTRQRRRALTVSAVAS